MNIIMKYSLLTGVCLLTIQSANAQEEDNPFSFSASAGFENDSNLTVDTIDNNSEVGDTAFVFDASLGYEILDTDETGLSVGYDFYQSLHDEFDAFDMGIHSFNIDGRRTLGKFDFGATYMFNAIKLGGEAFMNMNVIRPNVGYLFDNNLIYLIGSYEFQKQSFETDALSVRDATRHSISAKSIFLLGEGRTVTTGYELSDHNTEDLGFSFTGHTFDAVLKLPFEFIDREATFRAGYRYQARNFLEESQSYNDGETRADRRHTYSASLQAPIVNNFYGKIEIEFINANSNFEVVDFDETITTFSIGWEY